MEVSIDGGLKIDVPGLTKRDVYIMTILPTCLSIKGGRVNAAKKLAEQMADAME